MDGQRLDGNAAADPLRQIFSFETTTAEYACRECGRTGTLGGAMAYEVREMSIIVRCPGCSSALVRLAYNRGRYLIDLSGTRHLTTG